MAASPGDRSPAQPTARVGISGWRYPPWRGVFYPAGLRQADELAYAASLLGSIEINGSFYSLQRPPSYQAWYEQTAADFVFAVKGGRFVTHMKRLRDVDTALANFFASGPLALGAKLGPVLWQLPPTLPFEEARLRSFFDLLPRTTTAAAALAERHDARLDGRSWETTDADRPVRHALEVRHPSFAIEADALAALASELDVALVVADSGGRWPRLDTVTSDFVYVRLHGDAELYASGYTPEALDRWASRVRDWLSGAGCPDGVGRDVYLYFDNDAKVRAPFDALALQELLGAGPGPRSGA